MMINNNDMIWDLWNIVGSGYADMWDYQGRYLAIKGGRGSKKSKTTAIRWIVKLMEHPAANLLVIRKIFNTHRDSTFADLKWATYQLGIYEDWHFKTSPLEAVYIPTGQKILFRGLDNPLSITSITVEKGYLCWCWFEEAYQVTNEDDFNKVDMSIRGDTGGLFKQIVLTFNPWNESHWLKKRFFDVEQPNVRHFTTNYLCNEFLDDADRELFEWMKKHNPRRYRIEGMGDWGIAEGAIFDNWEERDFDYQEIAKRKGVQSAFGLDFGYSVDPTGFIALLVDEEQKEIYIYDEHYQRAMLNNEIANMIKYKGYSKEKIIADSSEPKSIAEIKKHGIGRIKAAEKGKDSILNGIQFAHQFKIYVHPKCTNTIVELSNYVWDQDKDGKTINKPVDEYNHLMDAMRYSLEPIRKGIAKAKAVKRI
jgi:phage terminase large subunit